MSPRYPEVRVHIDTRRPLHEIIELVDIAMRKAKVPTAQRCLFRSLCPRQYAFGIEWVREWVETD